MSPQPLSQKNTHLITRPKERQGGKRCCLGKRMGQSTPTRSDKNIPGTWPKTKLKRQGHARTKAEKRGLGMAHSCKIRPWPFRGLPRKVGHKEAEMQCKCGQRRARLHPFSCPTARPHRARLFSIDKKKPLTPSEIVGSPEGVRLFAGWAPETKLFGRSGSSGEVSET